MSQQSYGTVGLFDAAAKDWTSYEERFRLFSPPTRSPMMTRSMQGIFLTTCGAATYTLFRNLAAPKKPSEVPIADLMTLATAHYHPKPSLSVQRFRFNSQTRQAGESVTAYLAELKSLNIAVSATRSTTCTDLLIGIKS